MCNKNEKGVANANQSKKQPHEMNILHSQNYYTTKQSKNQVIANNLVACCKFISQITTRYR